MIKDLTLMAMQKAVNKTLSLDETRAQNIRALNGKTLRILVLPLQVGFFLHFTEQELQFHASAPGPVDTTIESSPLGLIRLSILPASKARSLFNEQIKISGDAELGQAVKQLFDELDIDWEGHLAQFTGDVIAHQMGSWARQAMQFKQQLLKSVNQSTTDFLQEELQLLPTREALQDFFTDVDTLNLTVERVTAELQLVLNRHEIP